MKRLIGLSPIYNSNSKVLILGTFPSSESLIQEKYYAHGTNAFWRLLFAVFDTPFSTDYIDRLKLLNENNIAVWDVIQSCIRDGSSDKKIIDPLPNSIPSLLKSQSTIKSIVLTSGDAKNYFFQFFPELKTSQYYQVVSSSSGTFGYSFERKLEQWKILKKLMGE